MDGVFSIILIVVISFIGYLVDRRKQRKNTYATTTRPPVLHKTSGFRSRPRTATNARPLHDAYESIQLPPEGERATCDTPPLQAGEAPKKEALKRHYRFWRNAVATQTVLQRNPNI